jgi:hypothetical protein
VYATVAERTGSVSVVRDASPHPPRPPRTTSHIRTSRSTSHAPLRLTRRGRMAVATAGALVIGVISMMAASAAQATSHPGMTGHGNLVKVMVESGQNLWSIAAGAEPDADPRGIIEQIRTLNSLPGYQVSPGEVLWVPRA